MRPRCTRDGTLTHEALAERARAQGVQLWALTDHDEIGGQHRAMAAARAKIRRLWKNCERQISTRLQFVHLAFLALLLKRL